MVRTLFALVLVLAVTDGGIADPPTFARLSFWVPAERMAEFEAAYTDKVLLILKAHALVESSKPGRETPDSVFSRLFEVKAPAEIAEKYKALRNDPIWHEVLRELGKDFGTTRADNQIRSRFSIYSAPAGPGKVVSTGPWKGCACRTRERPLANLRCDPTRQWICAEHLSGPGG